MLFLPILIFMPFFLEAMDQTSIMISSTEKSFLRNVLKVTETDQFHLIEKKEQHSCSTQDEERKIEQLKEQKEHYEQFLRWQQRPPATKLCDAQFLFSKMAAQNNSEGLIAIRDLTLEWKLITDDHQLLEKLDYGTALADAVESGCAQTTDYLLSQKGIPRTQFYDLLKKVCTREWRSNSKCSEQLQCTIAQKMIQKSALQIKELRALMSDAERNKAPGRIISCLYNKFYNHPEYSEYVRSHWLYS